MKNNTQYSGIKNYIRVGITLCFNLFLSISGYSQSDSLKSYLQIAAKNNPVVVQKFNEYQSALQKVMQVGSLNDPELSVGVFLRPMEIISGNQVADIRLMQMFPWFGVLKNSKDEMSLMAKAKYESFLDAKFQVYYDVQRTWYELFKMQEDIRISEENIELLHAIERISLVKFKSAPAGGSVSNTGTETGSGIISQYPASSSSGMQSMDGKPGGNQATASGPSSTMQSNSMGRSAGGSGLADLYRIQIEIGDLENNIALLKNQLKTITAKFNSYLNRPLVSIISLPGRLIPENLGISLVSVSDSIQQNNPMLEMLKYEQLSLDARKNMIHRMSYPMIGLGVNYSVINKNEMSISSMNGKDMIMPMLTVTLPIYRKKYRALKTETEFMKVATEQGYQSTSNSLQIEYHEAIQLYQDAQRRISLYENQGQLAQNTLDILIKGYSASGSDLTDVLRIRQQTLEYEVKMVDAVVDYNMAIAWLERLMVFNQMQ